MVARIQEELIMFNKHAILLLSLCLSNMIYAEDFCKLATDELSKEHSELLAVIKINTTQSRLYSSKVEISKDCAHYEPFLSVQDPDVVKTENGLCMVLPSGEMKPGLCGLHVTLCTTTNECQSIDYKMETKDGRYISASPAYYEMTF
jgi:hypothetical protein